VTSPHEQQQERELERRAGNVRDAVALIRDLRELQREGVENKRALEAALVDAREDAESAVIHWRAARMEFWGRRAAAAEAAPARIGVVRAPGDAR
jgi:hypothetical protein